MPRSAHMVGIALSALAVAAAAKAPKFRSPGSGAATIWSTSNCRLRYGRSGDPHCAT